jgi:DNA-binding transcriptional LysR family regulator
VPELRHLRVFVAVAEQLNFTRAAQQLFLGQQAVSKSIRQLERELGVVLLERSTHEVRLTAAGAELLQTGREALKATDAAFERARLVGRAMTGTITVGVSPAIGPTERAGLVRALRHGAPDLEVSIRDLSPQQGLTALRGGEVELVLARFASSTSELSRVPLSPTEARLYVPAEHRLATHEAPVPLANLDGERLLVWEAPGTPLTDLFLSHLAAAGCSVDLVRARVRSMVSAIAELSETQAVALLPPEWPHDRLVVELVLADPVPLPLTMIRPAGTASPLAERILHAMT